MSRSSKGFADFFPTAPSVLQQKKSKTAHQRKRQDSLADARNAQTGSNRTTPADQHGGQQNSTVLSGGDSDHVMVDAPPAIQDETEYPQGDLLNGVGSASSTSTVSSVFSAKNRALDIANHRGNPTTSHTPLTTASSSPPGMNKSPAHSKQESNPTIGQKTESKWTPPQNLQPPIAASTSPDDQFQARPGLGRIKGIKVTYDPELDRSLNSKERRVRKAEYKDITDEVCPSNIIDIEHK